MKTTALFRVMLLAAVSFPLTGCLFRSHKIEQPVSSATLKSATQEQLISWLNREASLLNSINATVDIATDVGGVKKGKVTEYQEIRGYILMRKPEMLRMIGLMPIVRNRAFDMVSDGKQFKLWIPPRNKFYVGANEINKPSKNALENLRPKVIYDALLVHPVTGPDSIAVFEIGNEVVRDAKTKKQVAQSDYEILLIQRGAKGWYLSRKFYFNRIDLMPDRQVVFDKDGQIATDVKYGEFKDYNGIPFPSVIQISRPQEEYQITIGIVKAVINEPLTDSQFTLTQPVGAQVIHIGNSGEQSLTSSAADGDSKK